jgi:hypothetical protein
MDLCVDSNLVRQILRLASAERERNMHTGSYTLHCRLYNYSG